MEHIILLIQKYYNKRLFFYKLQTYMCKEMCKTMDMIVYINIYVIALEFAVVQQGQYVKSMGF